MIYPTPLEPVIERLAERGYSTLSGFFSEDLLIRLYHDILQQDKQGHLQPAGIGRNQDRRLVETIRNDRTLWIEGRNETERDFLAALESLRLQLNQTLQLGLFSYEAHYAIYEPGGFYKRHVDSFKGQKNRILSLTLYLNPTWQESDGGLLHLYQDEQATEPMEVILPHMGHGSLFLSEHIPHEVSVAHKTRYSIAGWFKCR